MNQKILERARQLASASRRRADLVRWQEHYNRLATTKTRSPDERLARHQALALMEQARPGADRTAMHG